MMALDEELLRAAHRSLCVTWGTSSPYAIGRVRCERVGYADIPQIRVDVHCRWEDLDALVPVVRQRVFAELAERGWGDEHVEFKPVVGCDPSRRRRFVDENESSATCGKTKMAPVAQFGFTMSRTLARATFKGGRYAALPQREV